MITINFTLWVQLVLFLAFMWAINRVLFRPLLEVMDRRKEQIQADKAAVESSEEVLAEKEAALVERIMELRRQANLEYTQARWKSVEENNAELTAMRIAMEKEIEEMRTAYRLAIRAERGEFPAMANDIAAQMSSKLGLE